MNDEFLSFVLNMALAIIAFVIGMSIGNPVTEKKITTGRAIIIDNSSYRGKMIKTLKEE